MTPPVGLTIFIHLIVIWSLRLLRLFGFKVLVPSQTWGGEEGKAVVSFFIMGSVGTFLLFVVSNIMLLALRDSHATWRLLWGG